jgi:hypothetical protein
MLPWLKAAKCRWREHCMEGRKLRMTIFLVIIYTLRDTDEVPLREYCNTIIRD